MIGAMPQMPMIGDLVRGFPNFGMTWPVASLGLGFALFLSLAAGLIPAVTRVSRAHHRHAEDGLTWRFPSPTTSAICASAGR